MIRFLSTVPDEKQMSFAITIFVLLHQVPIQFKLISLPEPALYTKLNSLNSITLSTSTFIGNH